jgi:putative Holliday junction resolvase
MTRADKGRALGVDLGSKRIGIAISDPSRTIASPLTMIPRSGSPRRDHAAIAALVEEEDVTTIVVGLPLNMNGSVGPAAQAAIKEAKALATVVGMPVVTFDERRTTVTADRALMEGGIGAQARRKLVDKVAAAVMLQTWLDSGSPA